MIVADGPQEQQRAISAADSSCDPAPQLQRSWSRLAQSLPFVSAVSNASSPSDLPPQQHEPPHRLRPAALHPSGTPASPDAALPEASQEESFVATDLRVADGFVAVGLDASADGVSVRFAACEARVHLVLSLTQPDARGDDDSRRSAQIPLPASGGGQDGGAGHGDVSGGGGEAPGGAWWKRLGQQAVQQAQVVTAQVRARVRATPGGEGGGGEGAAPPVRGPSAARLGSLSTRDLDKMEAQTELLLQEAVHCVDAVAEAGRRSPEALPPRHEAVVMMVSVLQQLLEHGVKREWVHVLASPGLSPREVATVPASALSHGSPSFPAMLHALEGGWRAHPPVDLGIASLLAVRPRCSESAVVQAWLHAALNARSASRHLSALLARADALPDWTYDWAPLQRAAAMHAVAAALARMEAAGAAFLLPVVEVLTPTADAGGAAAPPPAWQANVLQRVSLARTAVAGALSSAADGTHALSHSISHKIAERLQAGRSVRADAVAASADCAREEDGRFLASDTALAAALDQLLRDGVSSLDNAPRRPHTPAASPPGARSAATDAGVAPPPASDRTGTGGEWTETAADRFDSSMSMEEKMRELMRREEALAGLELEGEPPVAAAPWLSVPFDAEQLLAAPRSRDVDEVGLDVAADAAADFALRRPDAVECGAASSANARHFEDDLLSGVSGLGAVEGGAQPANLAPPASGAGAMDTTAVEAASRPTLQEAAPDLQALENGVSAAPSAAADVDQALRPSEPHPDDGSATASTTDDEVEDAADDVFLERRSRGGADYGMTVGISRADEETDGSGTHTVYWVEVEINGRSQSVARRFNAFRQLQLAFAAAQNAGDGDDLELPSSWKSLTRAAAVTRRSRMSAEVVAARTTLLTKCLRDLLAETPHLVTHPLVLAFLELRPDDVPEALRDADKLRGPSAGARVEQQAHRLFAAAADDGLQGSSIRLSLQPPPTLTVPDARLAVLQKGRCRGCAGDLPAPPQASAFRLWRGNSAAGPRRCHFDGWLYCHDCHHGRASVVPSRVIAKWDFRKYPVSDNALDYLEATHSQQVLRIEDVNPGLFTFVPLLAEVHSLRVAVTQALDLARRAGPLGNDQVDGFLSKVGHRRYLLETQDMWSMDDLEDLSKGAAFAQLPQWLAAWRDQAQDLAAAAVLSSPRRS